MLQSLRVQAHLLVPSLHLPGCRWSWAGAAQVPYTLQDADISDDWRCEDNVWDKAFSACTVPQALSDEAIDAILAKQARAAHGLPVRAASTGPRAGRRH